MNQPKVNPLLDKVRMPGSTFSLPSGGGFYKDGEVKFENGKSEVYVSPMTTVDEIAITSLDKLLNGTAVSEVFSRCIPAVQDPYGLLSSDVDYLMVALRIVSMGKDTEVTYNHRCSEESKEHTYVVDVEAQILDKTKKLSKGAMNQYKVDLSTGIHIEFQPLTYGGLLRVQELLTDIQSLMQKRENETNKNKRAKIVDELNAATAAYFMALMSNVVASMDNIEDEEMIAEALAAMSLPLREELMDAFNEMDDWGHPSTVKLKCRDCGEEVEVPLDLNPVSFFTTRSRQKTST